MQSESENPMVLQDPELVTFIQGIYEKIAEKAILEFNELSLDEMKKVGTDVVFKETLVRSAGVYICSSITDAIIKTEDIPQEFQTLFADIQSVGVEDAGAQQISYHMAVGFMLGYQSALLVDSNVDMLAEELSSLLDT